MRLGDTIVALSSGALPSGVAVIRLSGPKTRLVLEGLCQDVPPARKMGLRALTHHNDTIDTGLVVYFPAPHSFTGEDCAELQMHGSAAVVKKLLSVITDESEVRLAEAGEFTRRAFENGNLDLVEAEGLSDLLSAQTEGQRQQAVLRMDGALSKRIGNWRQQLLQLRAEIEARLDFSDESDVDVSLPETWQMDLSALEKSLQAALDESAGGRIIRDGFRVAFAGPPNVGKSSLLNALSRSEVAIVSPEAGTTRDVREVPLDLGGQLVMLVDLAGLRESDSLAEAEGVRRAEAEIAAADLVLWLHPTDGPDVAPPFKHPNIWHLMTKSDLSEDTGVKLAVSVVSGDGIGQLLERITVEASKGAASGEPALVSHARDKAALVDALDGVRLAGETMDRPELGAEALRRASDALARLLGAMDPEQVLDQLFSQFCIGK